MVFLKNQGPLPKGPLSPCNRDEVSKIMKYACQHGVHVYTNAAQLPVKTGTSLWLHLEKMDKIIELDCANLVAIVEPGVTLGQLRKALQEEKLCFPPATPEKDDFTVGEFYGWGMSSLKGLRYGAAKYHVLGLEVVLANGELLKTGGKTVKNVTGYDLTRLFLSSRETLGVPVSYILKLAPFPEQRQYLVLRAKDEPVLLNLVRAILGKGVTPACLSFIDKKTLRISKVQEDEAWLGILCEGFNEAVQEQVAQILGMAEEVQVRWEQVEEERFFLQLSIPEKSGALALKESFKLPMSKWPELYSSGLSPLLPGVWGQVGEGKVNILLEEGAQLDGFTELLYLLGGIRSEQRPSPLSKGLKKALDPLGILNPWTEGEEV